MTITPPSPEELRRLYVTEGRSMRDMAGLLGVSNMTVQRWVKAAGIPIRRRGHARELVMQMQWMGE
jgi:transposase